MVWWGGGRWCKAWDGLGLFNLLPRNQEARLCLRCTAGLVEMLGQEPALSTGTHWADWGARGSIGLHFLQKQSRASLWHLPRLCTGKDLRWGMTAQCSFTGERVRPSRSQPLPTSTGWMQWFSPRRTDGCSSAVSCTPVALPSPEILTAKWKGKPVELGIKQRLSLNYSYYF